jgi:hypothetical protein
VRREARRLSLAPSSFPSPIHHRVRMDSRSRAGAHNSTNQIGRVKRDEVRTGTGLACSAPPVSWETVCQCDEDG